MGNRVSIDTVVQRGEAKRLKQQREYDEQQRWRKKYMDTALQQAYEKYAEYIVNCICDGIVVYNVPFTLNTFYFKVYIGDGHYNDSSLSNRFYPGGEYNPAPWDKVDQYLAKWKGDQITLKILRNVKGYYIAFVLLSKNNNKYSTDTIHELPPNPVYSLPDVCCVC